MWCCSSLQVWESNGGLMMMRIWLKYRLWLNCATVVCVCVYKDTYLLLFDTKIEFIRVTWSKKRGEKKEEEGNTPQAMSANARWWASGLSTVLPSGCVWLKLSFAWPICYRYCTHHGSVLLLFTSSTSSTLSFFSIPRPIDCNTTKSLHKSFLPSAQGQSQPQTLAKPNIASSGELKQQRNRRIKRERERERWKVTLLTLCGFISQWWHFHF